MSRWAWVMVLAAGGCTPDPEVLPPLGEVLIEVDCDAPVPRLVSKLRIDVYSDAGDWLDSREQPMVTRESWPGSFSLFIDDATQERSALVRLRAYSRTRDYRGERFLARPDGIDLATIVEPPPGDDQPRLVIDGDDVTPSSEPQPELTIDRLLRVRLRAGVRASAHVTLRTVCVGTMVDLAQRTTCIDAENQRVELVDHALLEGIVAAGPSLGEGPLSQSYPCNGVARADSGPPLHDGEVCIPGGLSVLGNDAIFSAVPSSEANVINNNDEVAQLNAFPERVAVIPPMFMDQHEVTVGRWRQALAEGLDAGDETIVNNGPVMLSGADQTPECTWSTTPMGRESYPLNCVSWRGARAFCQFHGGDLPTEAQWEYAASRTATGFESTYPWGDDPPTCERAVYARATGFGGLDKCVHLGTAVQPLDASLSDRSFDDVVGLAGSLTEWVLDSYRSYSSACWRSASLVNPGCWEDGPPVRSKRGSSWGTNNVLDAALRDGTKASFLVSLVGFRCVRWAG